MARRGGRRGGGRRGGRRSGHHRRHLMRRGSRFHRRPIRRYHTTYVQNRPWYDFWRPSYWSYYPYYLYNNYFEHSYYNQPYWWLWNRGAVPTYEYFGNCDESMRDVPGLSDDADYDDDSDGSFIRKIEEGMQKSENCQLFYVIILFLVLLFLINRRR